MKGNPGKPQHIPHAEDLPLILAWIKPNTDPLQKCEFTKCKRPARFSIDEYEDGSILDNATKRGVKDERVLEDMIWRATMAEQMLNQYTIHSVFHVCLNCELHILMHFLNTNKPMDILTVLTGVSKEGYTLVQYHELSDPEYGLLAVTRCTTIPDLLSEMRLSSKMNWKVQQ